MEHRPRTVRRPRVASRLVAIALLTVCPLPGTTTSAEARPSTGAGAGTSATCPLERIGDQFVRCDDLTGAGVAAGNWVPEQADDRCSAAGRWGLR